MLFTKIDDHVSIDRLILRDKSFYKESEKDSKWRLNK